MTGRDLTRPLDWALGNPTPLGIAVAQISTVVALIHLGDEVLARRLAASITGTGRREVARFHQATLTKAIFDDLNGQPEASLEVDEVFAEVVTFAESLDDPPPDHRGQRSGLGNYDVAGTSRAEEPDGRTSPEELIAAARASCFSMALANAFSQAGIQTGPHNPKVAGSNPAPATR